MGANNDPISKAFGLTPLPKSNAVIDIMSDALNDSAKSDFEKARSNLLKVIETGMQSLETLSQVAEQTQSARAFEMVAKLIDSIAQANKDLLELQQSIRTIDAADVPSKQSGSVTNNLFIGSTAQLQELIKRNQKQIDG